MKKMFSFASALLLISSIFLSLLGYMLLIFCYYICKPVLIYSFDLWCWLRSTRRLCYALMIEFYPVGYKKFGLCQDGFLNKLLYFLLIKQINFTV